jgi:sarcosine oxidase subunit gamma
MSDAMSVALTLTEPAPRAIVAIGAYRDRAPLIAALQTGFGLTAPTTPSFMASGGITLSCLAPGRYLATADRASALFVRVTAALSNIAALTDQSDLWHHFTLSGAAAADALARLVPIDLGPHAFPVGALALTRAGHLHVRLWHLSAETYELAVARSYADDLRHDLENLTFRRQGQGI